MKLLLVFCLMLLPALVISQQSQTSVIIDKKVICDEFDKMIEVLVKKEYNEQILWIGSDKNSDSKYAIMANQKTGTWTVIQYNKEAACIIGAGEHFRILDISEKI